MYVALSAMDYQPEAKRRESTSGAENIPFLDKMDSVKKAVRFCHFNQNR